MRPGLQSYAEHGKRWPKVILLVLFFLCVIFFLLFLYKHILLEKIFLKIQDKADYLKDYNIQIPRARGGILSELILHDVVIKRKGENNSYYKFLVLSKVRIDFSLIELIKVYFFKTPFAELEVSLYNPTFYLPNKFFTKNFSITPEKLSGLRRSKLQNLFQPFNLEKIKIEVINCNFVSLPSYISIIHKFNSNIIMDLKKITLKNTNFNLLNFPLALSGYFYIDSEKIDLKVKSDFDPIKFKSFVFGELDNFKFVIGVRGLKRFNYYINGLLNFEHSKIYFSNIDILPSNVPLSCKINTVKDKLPYRYENNKEELERIFSPLSHKLDNWVYKIQGFYDIVTKQGNFEIKKISSKKEKYRMLYFDDFRFSQLFNLDFELAKFPEIKMNLRIRRLMLKDLNYITNLHLKGEMGFKNEYFFKGRLHSSGSVLNYKPFYEIDSDIKIKNKRLKIENLTLEDILKLTFSLQLEPFYIINMKMNTSWIDVGKMLNQFYPQTHIVIEGKGKMKLNLNGKLMNPNICGNIVGKNGKIGNLDFILLKCNFKGNKKWLKFYDSKVLQQDNYYDIYGGMSLSDIGDLSFLKDIELVSDTQTFMWQGWTFLKKEKGEGLELEKKLGKGFSIGFSAYLYQEDKGKSQPLSETNGLELEYSLTEDKSLKLELKGKEEIFGLQQSIKF